MKKYWLYIESFTFIFKGTEGFLFFNSVSNRSITVSLGGSAFYFIEQLLKPENMYCIEITDEEIDKYKLSSFIKSLRNSFLGDLLDQEITKSKPIVIYPKLSIMKSRERLNHNRDNNMLGENILSYLHEINIYLLGDCMLDCNACGIYEKQVTTCFKNTSELDISVLNKLFCNIQSSSIYNISFIGGDIFRYTYFKEFCNLLKNIPIQTILYNHYLNIIQNLEKLNWIPGNCIFYIIIPNGFLKNELDNTLKLLEKSKSHFKLVFYVTKGHEYSNVVSFCEKRHIKKYSILPVYNGINIDFFKQNVFIDNNSIFSVSHSKKEIFSRMSLNTNDFGKLTIMSNGDIYSNVNFPKLGNIYRVSLNEILYSEFIDGKSWFRIRNEEPCNSCFYQWLCPSPSNYELAIGKPNLCHIK